MGEPIRLLVVDPHYLSCLGLHVVIAAEQDMRLVGEGHDYSEAAQLCRDLRPDVLLLAWNLPDQPHFETAAFACGHFAELKVLVLAAFCGDSSVKALVAAGVAGCVLKDELPATIISAIRAVAQGQTWFSQPVVAKLVEWGARRLDQPQASELTDRELEVLRHLVKGWSNKQIATSLGISSRTVRYHLQNMYATLGVSTRGEAVAWATRQGFTEE